MSTPIDLSRLPLPAVIEPLDFEALYSGFLGRFIAYWEAARADNPILPAFDVQMLESDPAAVTGQAWSYLRLLDRARVNDAVKALLAPYSTGSNLDNLVAKQNIARLVVVPATDSTPAVMEGDVALLRRYLLSFERASAGSRNAFLFEAWTAWPGMMDARVNGHAVHGRRGDIEIIIVGPAGRLATDEEKALVRAAVTKPHVQPEAVAVAVLNATRQEYVVDLVIEVPPGPDPELVRQEVADRITAAADARMVIGGEIPPGYLTSSAYGSSVIRVRDNAPVDVAQSPTAVPVMVGLQVQVEVRQ